MKAPKTKAAPEPVVASNELLASASAHLEMCHKRGQMCRGAYISDESGAMYMDKDGAWTRGIAGEKNWWKTLWYAEEALKAQNPDPPECELCGETEERCKCIHPDALKSNPSVEGRPQSGRTSPIGCSASESENQKERK